ncbi:MAG: TetR/AcrR family transcriptional regulator C-terminal domain-containing protein [Geodermatophilaceae bacterium]|nr:TetR/AcrR family transcriptional regulator C-terminal domain-containing protein [Geodermatophilaceae bacterium]MDQ3457295.1 TetR/AcrR family transcriptional regulator C-terminal domain-containing protein [Actinomycetota bacterium]
MRRSRISAGDGPRTGLSTERVRAAALRILDTEGSEALSMRRLAQALDREAMTLYRYAPNKAALLDGVVELVLSDLSVDPAAADWCQELGELAEKYQELVLGHPHVLPLLVTLPRATPLGMRPIGTVRLLEDFIELLTRAGFTHSDALHAYRLFFGFLHGHALGQLQEAVQNADEAADQLRLALHQLPREKFPHLHALANQLSAYDGAAELHEGLEMVITGLRSFLSGRRPATR